MGIKEWAIGQRVLGNPEAVIAGEELLKKYGDVITNSDGTFKIEPYEPASVSQLVRDERDKLENFFHKIIKPPEPTIDFNKKLETGLGLGFSFEPRYLPAIEMGPDTEIPEWRVRPPKEFWDKRPVLGPPSLARNPRDAMHHRLREGWILVERDMPNKEDPIGHILGELRETRKINSRHMRALDIVFFPKSGQKDREAIRKLPIISRFGLSASELEEQVNHRVARLLKSNQSVRQPTFLEFNVLGNMHYPEWGSTNFSEWMETELKQGERYFGGSALYGGLEDVRMTEAIGRDVNRGFRIVA